MRQFRDNAGVEWQVYQTERAAAADRRRDHLLPVEYREGWLVFESESEKRRLAPVPPDWAQLSDEALAAFCASAAIQTRAAKRSEPRATGDAADVAALGQEERGRTGIEAAELQATEKRLKQTLSQVCDAPSVDKLDTGELIRVKETLAIAAETAKKVVSLRRKRRSQRSPREQQRQEPRD